MSPVEAIKLATSLSRRHALPDGQLVTVRVAGGRVVFGGGRSGEHSIDVGVSSAERVRAHFAGYCESNGLRIPGAADLAVGTRVRFPSGSAADGWRVGRVEKVGRSRALVSYRFDYGRAASKLVPFAALTVVGR